MAVTKQNKLGVCTSISDLRFSCLLYKPSPQPSTATFHL